MNHQNWKIFSKSGDFLNWYPNTYIPLTFLTGTTTPTGAAAFAITNPSNYIIDVEVTNSGWGYNVNDTQVQLDYSLANYSKILSNVEASIGWKDVSIFNPLPSNTKGVGSVLLNIADASFLYPSVSYSSALFLDPISQGLVETEHIIILEESSLGTLIRPYDTVNPYLIFKFSDGDPEIKLFEIDEDQQIISWSDELVVDMSEYVKGTGIMINVGFRAETEGIFERKLRIYHRVGSKDYLLAEILINAESIGEDERFDTLITNFGLPNPKTDFSLFKEADINEALPDWELVNYKAKHIILEHDRIMPYIGTYKALINAIKWLGYEDIQIKEWFKNVKDGTKLALYVPYDAADRTKTLLYFSPEERKNLKKLNQLSLVYCITRDTGRIDQWGNPIVEECYNYNLNEILVKLYALKQWLERWIIGVNARITDITGEGVYFERFRNLIYSTQNIGIDANFKQSLSPATIDESSELSKGDASIRLTLEELKKMPISALQLRFKDLIRYCWDPSNGSFTLADASSLFWDPSTIYTGSTFQFPFIDLFDIQWRASVLKEDAGVVIDKLVTKPLFIYWNELRFYNVLDSSTTFYDVSSNLHILLENAVLRDPSNDIWEDSAAYTIYPDPSGNGHYWMESSSGFEIYKSNGYVDFVPATGSNLLYEFDSNYKVPLLSFKNYKFQDASGNVITLNKKYFLDILDGKISMDSSIAGVSGEKIDVTYYINWNYDISIGEQQIVLSIVYNSPRMPLAVYDPSIYYSMKGGDPISSRVIDNSIYTLPVNFTGDYHIEVFGWDGFNNIYSNQMETTYPIWTKYPVIYSLVDCSYYCLGNESSIFTTPEEVSTLISKDKYPIYDRNIPLSGITLRYDGDGKPFIEVPSITYFQSVPETDSINKFFNLTERVISISGSDIVVDPDYQKFYTGDDIKLVKLDSGKYSFILEASSHIVLAVGNTLTLDQIPNGISIDSSSDIYLLNDTYRTVSNPINIGNYLSIDISGYVFDVDQLVGVIITDNSNGYSWGSSYRVISIDGSTHILDHGLPQFFINDPSKYTIQAKHGFSSYADFSMVTSGAVETDNKFKIYLKDTYCQEYFLDNTFVMINIPFSQDYVNSQWYNVSDNLIHSNFYHYSKPITVDISTLVILRSIYDPSNYMLNQKNIWSIYNHEDGMLTFRVFNDIVPFIFDVSGTYDIIVDSFDQYGNLKTQTHEGLIKVR